MKTKAMVRGVLLSLVIAAPAAAETVCFDSVSYCTDLRLQISPVIGTKTSGTYAVKGREYGCGVEDRVVYGAMRIKGGLWYFGMTYNTVVSGSINNDSFVYVYNPKTKTGTANMFIDNSAGGSDVAFTFNKVTCQAGIASLADGPDPNVR